MSGLSRTPGKRVRVNSPPRVRIPPSPPNAPFMGYFVGLFLGGLHANHTHLELYLFG